MRGLSISVLALVVLLTGCSRNSSDIMILGSTSMQPLVQEIADSYVSARVDYQGVGSSAGIKAVIDGTSDIGASSRELTFAEKALDINEYIIAYDAIVVAVNPENSVSDLSARQVAAIFEGRITNWNEVGGDDAEIIVISRESGAGTRNSFEENIKIKNLSEKAVYTDGNGAVQQNILSKKYAVGYVSRGFMEKSLKPIKIDGKEATDENVKSGAYKIIRSFFFFNKGVEKEKVCDFIKNLLRGVGEKINCNCFITVR